MSQHMGYFIGFVDIHGGVGSPTFEAHWPAYEAGAGPAVEAQGGVLLAVDDAPRTLEGAPPDHRRIVLAAYPSGSAAQAMVDSPAYQAAAEHRRAASDSDVVVVAGLADAPPGAGAAPASARRCYHIVLLKLASQALYDEHWTTYEDQATAAVVEHGGHVLAVDSAPLVMEGSVPELWRIVIVEYPSAEHARAMYDSQVYQDAAVYRRKASSCIFLQIEGQPLPAAEVPPLPAPQPAKM